MKLTKLAVIIGLAGSALAMFSSPAQAFSITYDGRVTQPRSSSLNYQFTLNLAAGETFNPNATINFGFTNVNVTGGQDSSGSNTYNVTTTSTNALFTATKANTLNTYFLDVYGTPTATDLVVQACYNPNNGSGNTCYNNPNGFTPGTTDLATQAAAAVPEAESALVPVLALGFGYLYRSKKRKNLQVVATQDQARSFS